MVSQCEYSHLNYSSAVAKKIQLRAGLAVSGLALLLVACSGGSGSGVASHAGNYSASLCYLTDPNNCEPFELVVNSDGLATMTGQAITNSSYGQVVGSVDSNGLINTTTFDTNQNKVRFSGTITGKGAGKVVNDGLLYLTVTGQPEAAVRAWKATCSTSCD